MVILRRVHVWGDLQPSANVLDPLCIQMPGSIYELLGAAEIIPWCWEGGWDMHLMVAEDGGTYRASVGV